MGRRLRACAALALAASFIGLSSSPQAAEITTIQYSLLDSTMHIVAPFPTINPLSAGSMTLRFTDGITNGVVDGGAAGLGVDMLSLFMSINPNYMFVLAGSLRLTMTAPALGGALGAGYALGPFGGSAGGGLGVQNGFIHCLSTLSLCGGGLNLPNSVSIPIGANSVPFPITVPNLGPQGTPVGPNPIFFNPCFSGLNAVRPFAGLAATGSFQATGSFRLVGSEIGRTVISTPEPGVFPMLVLGALGLAGSVGWTRRRSR